MSLVKQITWLRRGKTLGGRHRGMQDHSFSEVYEQLTTEAECAGLAHAEQRLCLFRAVPFAVSSACA